MGCAVKGEVGSGLLPIYGVFGVGGTGDATDEKPCTGGCPDRQFGWTGSYWAFLRPKADLNIVLVRWLSLR